MRPNCALRFAAWSMAAAGLLAASACVSSGPKPVSGWEVLASAESARCAAWPLREKDFGVKEVLLAEGGAPGFVVSGIKRNTAPMHYYAPFDNDPSLDVETFHNLDLGRGAVLLGGSTAGGRELAFVARNAGGQATLEVRTVRDNIVRFKGPLANVAVEEGYAVATARGAWLSVAGDDGSYRLAYVDLAGKMSIKAVPAATRSEPSRVLVNAAQPKGALLVWREGKEGEQPSKEPFKAQWVTTEGEAESAVELDVPIASQVESWSATRYGGGYYLAFVDGDSLIGSSELKVTHLNWDDNAARVRWTKAVKQVDEHVTEPMFLVSGRGLEVLVLKWIDEESTIARYMVASATVGKPSFSGIFPKGSRVLAAFAGDGDAFVLIRSRGESGWIFRVCEI